MRAVVPASNTKWKAVPGMGPTWVRPGLLTSAAQVLFDRHDPAGQTLMQPRNALEVWLADRGSARLVVEDAAQCAAGQRADAGTDESSWGASSQGWDAITATSDDVGNFSLCRLGR